MRTKFGTTWGLVTAPYQLAHEIQQMRKEKPQHHVFISADDHPETAAHAEDAQNGTTYAGNDIVNDNADHPRDVTIDREDAASRRREAVKVVPAQPRSAGIDRDEYPPAVFKEDGSGSSVRYIDASDNRGAGSSLGHQMRELADGTEVTINVR